MAILAECPICRQKQNVKNKSCSKCSEDLDKAKKSKRVKYHIRYWAASKGKYMQELIGFSADDAKAADSARRVQRRTGKLEKIIEMMPTVDSTFDDLAKWYLNLESVKDLAMFKKGVLQILLNHFNSNFGHIKVNTFKASMLKNFESKQKKAGHSHSYIDQQIGAVQGVIRMAFEDDMISGDCLRPFAKRKKLLKKNANARDMIFTQEQYAALMANLPEHLKPICATAYWTGMRRDEILSLTWDKVFLKQREIRLRIDDTKDSEPRVIPILSELYEILKQIPRAIRIEYASFVFLYKGKPIHDIREGFKAGMKGAGVPFGRNVPGGLTFHDFRHTFNTNMRLAGVPEKLIMKITGHSTREMFDRYTTITPIEIARVESQVQDYFLNNSTIKESAL